MAYQDGDTATFGPVTFLRRNGLWSALPDPVLSGQQDDWSGGGGDGSYGSDQPAPPAAAGNDGSVGGAALGGAAAGAIDPAQLAGQIAQLQGQMVHASDPVTKLDALWQLRSLIVGAAQQQGGASSDGSDGGGDDSDPSSSSALLRSLLNQQNGPQDPNGGGNGAPQAPLPPPLLGQADAQQASDDGSGGSGGQGSGIPLLPPDQQNPPPFMAGLAGAPGGIASLLQQIGGPQAATALGSGGANASQPSMPWQGRDQQPGSDDSGAGGGDQGRGIPLLPPDQQNPPSIVAGFPGVPGDVASALQQVGALQEAPVAGNGPAAPQRPSSLLDVGAPGTPSDDQQRQGGLLGMPGQPIIPQPTPTTGGLGTQGRPPLSPASAQQPFQPNSFPPGGPLPGQTASGSQSPFGGAPAGFRLASLDSPSDGQAVLRTYGSPLDPVLGLPASIARAPVKGASTALGRPQAPSVRPPSAPHRPAKNGAQKPQQPPPPLSWARLATGLFDAQGRVNRAVWHQRLEIVGERSPQSAVSGAGAVGVMQVLPRTARQTAKRLGVPYSYYRLKHDINYNRMIGYASADYLLDHYHGNVVLATAAYNWGMGHLHHFLSTPAGAPPSGGASDANFAQRIPDEETQFYVGRVVYDQPFAQQLQIHRWRQQQRKQHTATGH